MSDVYIGNGKLKGKGVYASRDFATGETVKFYHLKKLTQHDFDALSTYEQRCVHSFWGEMYLFPEPSRYTNHSPNPNTKADLTRMCDIAIRPIKKGEMITTNATQEIHAELRTFIEAQEKTEVIRDFTWLKGGYRNAVIRYIVGGRSKTLILKRRNGNWTVLREE